MLEVKVGQIINEYSMQEPTMLFCSYFVLERSKDIGEACRRTPKTFRCFCLYSHAPHTFNNGTDKPGEIVILRGDWINSKELALERSWPTYWAIK
jgi:hypothetical protein